MHRQRHLFIALGLLTLLRLALLPTLELAPGEALVVVRERLGAEFSFIGSSPFLIWLARAGSFIAGEGPLGARFFSPWLMLVTSLMLWRVARALFDEQVAGWTVVLVSVMPAFNLAAVSLGTAAPIYAFTAIAAWALRTALLHANPMHWAWLLLGGCGGMMTLVQPGASVTLMAGVVAALGIPERRRHHLREMGFGMAAGIAVISWIGWAIWQQGHGWPALDLEQWQPCLYVAPNILRWSLLVSPLLLTLMAWATLRALQGATQQPMQALVLGMLFVLAGADFLWGPWESWPEVGMVSWTLFGAMLLARQGVMARAKVEEHRISLRTVSLVLAALQSAFLLQTDLPRSVGLPWSFAQRVANDTPYLRFFSADPAANQHGWHQGAALVADVLAEATLNDAKPWFVIAANDLLAAGLNVELPGKSIVFRPDHTFPHIHSIQGLEWNHSYAWWPRYDAVKDGRSLFEGRNALYVTDDAAATEPPAVLLAQFRQTRILAHARVVHGGQRVRALKIFACYDYQTPDW